jgi:hypothetical protein
VDRGAIFARDTLHVPDAETYALAVDAVTHVWEECKFGRAVAEDHASFWAMVSKRLYEIRNTWRAKRRELSMDEVNPRLEGEEDGHSSGWNGYAPPNQIDVTYYHQVCDGIELLPEKYVTIMKRLAEGHNAIDISEELRLPIHTVFARIREGRQLLFDRELVGMALDARLGKKSYEGA